MRRRSHPGIGSVVPAVSRPRARDRPVFFTNAAAFEAWLERHADQVTELTVGYYKIGSGRPSLTWPESVDAALCFGWIDGVRRRIDEVSYQIRFTPRRPDSIWSAINIDKVKALTAAGRMRPAGLEAFARRTARKSTVYSYEQAGKLVLTREEEAIFRGNAAAWSYLQQAPPSYRRSLFHWIASARQASTRSRRLGRVIAACSAGQRLLP